MLRLLTAGSVEEQICKAAVDKLALADRCITGGFFDGKTGAQERQAYLLSLIRPTDSAADRCCVCCLIMFRSSLHTGWSLKGVRSVSSADFDWKIQLDSQAYHAPGLSCESERASYLHIF